MREELFEELLESIKQGGAILRGEMKPSRVFEFDHPNVRLIRNHYGLSQSKFAGMLGISVSTLRNWEQGRRQPEGAARVLLRVAAKYPDAVLDVVYQTHGTRVKKNGKALRAEKKIRWPNKKAMRIGKTEA
jgi:putative transcriptional regulator